MDSYVVGWIGLAVINAALANLDGRGPLKYFLGSWFLGPVITLILASTREGPDGALRQVDLWKGGVAGAGSGSSQPMRSGR
jgi:hypothetical protein